MEFLNAQMGTVEVLLVEARQYEGAGISVVAPTLFGFTERIREMKRAVSTEQGRRAVATDWGTFRANAVQKGTTEEGSDAEDR